MACVSDISIVVFCSGRHALKSKLSEVKFILFVCFSFLFQETCICMLADFLVCMCDAIIIYTF